MREGLSLAGAGLGLGLIGAAMSARLLSSLLFAVQPLDPITFTFVSVTLAGAAVLACIIPAFRAVRVDPATALRMP